MIALSGANNRDVIGDMVFRIIDYCRMSISAITTEMISAIKEMGGKGETGNQLRRLQKVVRCAQKTTLFNPVSPFARYIVRNYV